MSLRERGVSEVAGQVGQAKADLFERVEEEREDHRPEAGPTAPTTATQQTPALCRSLCTRPASTA